MTPVPPPPSSSPPPPDPPAPAWPPPPPPPCPCPSALATSSGSVAPPTEASVTRARSSSRPSAQPVMPPAISAPKTKRQRTTQFSRRSVWSSYKTGSRIANRDEPVRRANSETLGPQPFAESGFARHAAKRQRDMNVGDRSMQNITDICIPSHPVTSAVRRGCHLHETQTTEERDPMDERECL